MKKHSLDELKALDGELWGRVDGYKKLGDVQEVGTYEVIAPYSVSRRKVLDWAWSPRGGMEITRCTRLYLWTPQERITRSAATKRVIPLSDVQWIDNAISVAKSYQELVRAAASIASRIPRSGCAVLDLFSVEELESFINLFQGKI